MDLAYDHIQEEALAPEKSSEDKEKKPETTLNSDFQEAYKAISSSPWGAKLGGFFGSVVKQVNYFAPLFRALDADSFIGRICLQGGPTRANCCR
jgi:hypothetical protein